MARVLCLGQRIREGAKSGMETKFQSCGKLLTKGFLGELLNIIYTDFTTV